jgi:hypothetical protein
MENEMSHLESLDALEITVCEVAKSHLPAWLELPKLSDSSAVIIATWLKPELVSRIGLPRESICGFLTKPNDCVVPDKFIEYAGFFEAIHNICKERLDPQLTEFASRTSERRAVLIDQRSPDVNAEIPTEDIIGTYEIENGLVGEFTANPNYRLVTSKGCMQLTPWLRQCLYSLVAPEDIA